MALKQLKGYLMGLVLFTLMIVGGMSLMTIFAAHDPTFLDNGNFSKFNESMNKYNELRTGIGTLEAGVITDEDSGAQEKQTLGFFDNLINKFTLGLRSVFTLFAFMDNMFEYIGFILGLPENFPLGILLGLLVTLLFILTIWAAIFRTNV